jgi:excisionase family DNA binding protein
MTEPFSEHIDLSNKKCELNEAWLDSKEAAAFLKMSVETLRNLVSNGQVPYYKLGRRNRYILSELDQLLRSNPKGERCEYKRK